MIYSDSFLWNIYIWASKFNSKQKPSFAILLNWSRTKFSAKLEWFELKHCCGNKQYFTPLHQLQSNFAVVILKCTTFLAMESVLWKSKQLLEHQKYFLRGAHYLTWENLDVVWAEFSSLGYAIWSNSAKNLQHANGHF